MVVVLFKESWQLTLLEKYNHHDEIVGLISIDSSPFLSFICDLPQELSKGQVKPEWFFEFILLIFYSCLENLLTCFTISLFAQFVGQVADETQKWTQIYGDQTNNPIVVVVLFKES